MKSRRLRRCRRGGRPARADDLCRARRQCVAGPVIGRGVVRCVHQDLRDGQHTEEQGGPTERLLEGDRPECEDGDEPDHQQTPPHEGCVFTQRTADHRQGSREPLTNLHEPLIDRASHRGRQARRAAEPTQHDHDRAEQEQPLNSEKQIRQKLVVEGRGSIFEERPGEGIDETFFSSGQEILEGERPGDDGDADDDGGACPAGRQEHRHHEQGGGDQQDHGEERRGEGVDRPRLSQFGGVKEDDLCLFYV